MNTNRQKQKQVVYTSAQVRELDRIAIAGRPHINLRKNNAFSDTPVFVQEFPYECQPA